MINQYQMVNIEVLYLHFARADDVLYQFFGVFATWEIVLQRRSTLLFIAVGRNVAEAICAACIDTTGTLHIVRAPRCSPVASLPTRFGRHVNVGGTARHCGLQLLG
jgi:hypothetical protein